MNTFRTIILFSFSVSLLFPQRKPIDIESFSSKYFKRYTVNDGLPQSTINCMTVDKQGRLWIGTQDGAAYYNVRNWKTVNMPGRGVSNNVGAMYCADDSAMFFGTDNGMIYRLKNDLWSSILDSSLHIERRIWDFVEVENGKGGTVLYIATGEGLLRYEHASIRICQPQFPNERRFVVNKIQRGIGNMLWLATNYGLVLFRDSVMTLIDGPLGEKNLELFNVLLDNDSTLWCSGNDALYGYKNGVWTITQFHSKGSFIPLRSMIKGSDGALWIGGQDMSFRCTIESNGTVQPAVVSEDTKLVYSIVEYPKGIYWFGTLTGLYRYSQSSWRFLNKSFFPGSSSIYSIYEDKNGDMYFGTLNGLFVFSNGKWKKYDTNSGLRANIIYSIIENENDDLWIATDGGGVNIRMNTGWKYLTTADGLPSNQIHSLFKDSYGGMWVSTSSGAVRIHKNGMQKISKSMEFPFTDVAGVTEDRDGVMWIASTNGITQWKDEKFSVVTPPKELLWGGFQCIYTASDGSIWSGTSGNGVLWYNVHQKRWYNYSDTSMPALANNIVYGIREDEQQRIYFLTNNGVTRFTKKNDSSGSPFYADHFNVDDGLMNAEGNIGALFVDSKKRIWAGTIDGVSYVNPTSDVRDSMPNTIIIDEVKIKNVPVHEKVSSGAILKYDQNDVIFSFSLLTYFKESEITYQVQLTGLDQEPLPWTNDFRKEYTNLPAGSYVCRVWGKDSKGTISGPAEFHFIIDPPYWRTWWFRSIGIFVLVTIIVLSVRLYIALQVRKETEKIERQRFIERERIRISQDMHDEIGSSLTRISLLSEMVRGGVEQQDPAGVDRDVIDKVLNIGDISRSTIDSINEIIWSINPRYDNLESLVQYMSKLANEVLSLKNIQFELELPNTIPDISFSPDFRRNIFLIFKEGLSNVLKHAQATFVRIAISTERDAFSFMIQDNGVGIAAQPSSRRSNRMGLDNMTKRAHAVGGEVIIESLPNQGTRLQFTMGNLQQHLI